MVTTVEVWNHLRELKDPLFGAPLSVVDVGLVHEVKIAAGEVRDPARELRLVDEGSGEEIPCQVNLVAGDPRRSSLVFSSLEVRVIYSFPHPNPRS